MRTADIVADTSHDTLDRALAMDIYSFFTIFGYSLEKAEREKKEMERWKRGTRKI